MLIGRLQINQFFTGITIAAQETVYTLCHTVARGHRTHNRLRTIGHVAGCKHIAVGRNEEEKQALLDYLLPKMLVAGFSTITISSLLVVGFVLRQF